jgi:hypothetical protein
MIDAQGPSTQSAVTYQYQIGQVYNQIGWLALAGVPVEMFAIGGFGGSTSALQIVGISGVMVAAFVSCVLTFVRVQLTKVSMSNKSVYVKRPYSTTKVDLAEAKSFELDHCVIRPGYVVRLHTATGRPVRTSLIALNGRLDSKQNDRLKAIVQQMNDDLAKRRS